MEKGLHDRVEDFAAYVKTNEFNYESLLKIQRIFHRDFNRSPQRVLRKIRQEGFFSVNRLSFFYCGAELIRLLYIVKSVNNVPQ